ncbi:hypothetical protein ACIPEQ_03675 [Curtobacterium sp. NPDC087080]|uniref:hypothetical protein n=1 Tax=Curtobacterium sp. NPDC087080 TaxID=3363965 RepID=UPI00381F6A9A
MREEVVVEVGGWEHECCGPAHELDTVASFTALGPGPRYDESRHHETPDGIVELRGRIVALFAVTEHGTRVGVQRIPSGRALRGFDEHDDGHLEAPWTGEPVTVEADHFEVVLDRYVPQTRQ